MICPYCKCYESKVLETDHFDEEFMTQRRRKCSFCNKRYTTIEKVRLPKENKNDGRFKEKSS